MENISVIPVIISGGAGSRLWPLSREAHPKPFIKLSDGESLLQKTFIRAAAVPNVKEILTITNREVFFHTQDEYRAAKIPTVKTSYILESKGRNTAPAITTAALYLAEIYDKNSILLILPADHLIYDQEKFLSTVEQAIYLAQKNHILTFGMKPQHPETGYGYLEIDPSRELLNQNKLKQISSYAVSKFIEKPTLERALGYVESGQHFWNSGMFCFNIETFLHEMSAHAPEIVSQVKNTLASSRQFQVSPEYFVLDDSFENLPDISLDYALMEKSTNIAAVTCDIGWNDIGSWNALSELTKADANGNRILGESVLHDTANCYIHGSSRVIGTVGLNNLVIVDMPDALLVADRDRSQEVKHIVQRLKKLGNDVVSLHREVHRPWGSYTIIDEGQNFKMKRIKVKPGGSLSLQMHYHRSEHWIVVSGTALVVNGDRQFLVISNESTFIPAGNKHRLENPGKIDLVIVEVQSGVYLAEDDILRFEDKYGRVPAESVG